VSDRPGQFGERRRVSAATASADTTTPATGTAGRAAAAGAAEVNSIPTITASS
jgi:hypothetical protein